MLTGRLRPPASGRSDWYSQTVKTTVYLDIFVIPNDSSTNTD